MRATRLEFRLRLAIMTAIVVLGFWAPWIEAIGSGPGSGSGSGLGFGRRMMLMEWLALEISRLGLLPFTVSNSVMIVFAAMLAALGALLRIWGAAYLGFGTVHSLNMQAGTVMADGPYRHVRNPLYLGGWFTMAAMAMVMSPTGALFAMVLLTVFFLRLILAEEHFLTAQIGQPYRDYVRRVPRLLPQVRTSVPPAHHKPQWITGLLTEFMPVGVFLTLAVLSWSYNHWLLIRGILISFGIALVARALVPARIPPAGPAS